MAAARPIVATSIGSQREVAAHAEMALLVPPADALALSQAILHLVADPALRERLAANARAVYESRYTEARMLHSYRQLYLDLVRAKCAARPASSVPLAAWPPLEIRQPEDQERSVLVPASHHSEGDRV
jgi:hypothetical protein